MKNFLTKTGVLTLLILFGYNSAYLQCTSSSSYEGAVANNSGVAQTLTTCAFGGEYSPYSSVISGNTYSFTATGGAGNFITVRQTNGTGTVVASGNSPLTGVVSPISGTLAVIVHASAACATDSDCHTIVGNCTSCTPPPPPTPIVITSAPVTNQALVCHGTNYLSATSVPATCGGASNLYKGGMEAWYTFTPTVTDNYIISISGQTYTSIFVYAGNPASGGTCVNSVGTSTSSKSLIVNLIAGTTYHIWFDTYPSPNSPCPGTFSIMVVPPPPANDNCAGATTLTVNADFSCGVTTNGTTLSATQSTETAPSCSPSGVNDDVWYKFIATNTQHRVSISAATSASAIAVYSGSCGSLTQISGACATTSSGAAAINFTGLTIGTTYTVRVYTTSATVGINATFTLCIGTPPPVPANDLCSGAIALACGQTLTGYTFSSTLDNAPTCNSVTNTAPGVWYAFTGNGGTATISLCGSAFDTYLSVYTGNCAGLTCVTASDDFCSTQSQVSFTTAPCVTYYVLVHGYLANVGNFTIAATCTAPPAPPANDVCSGATTVTCGSIINGNTTTALSDAAMGACGIGSGGTPGKGLWYKLTGNGAQVTLNLCGSSFNTKVHVYSGVCGSLTCIVSNDDAAGCSSNRSIAVFNANVGTDYYILVSGASDCDLGAFSMDISCLCGPQLSFPWTVSNIGSSNGNGIDNVCNGTIDISASNFGSPSSDVQTFANQEFCGNFTITGKLVSVTNLGWGGLMVRENDAPGSKKVAIRTQLNSLFVRDLRATTNGVQSQQQWSRPTHSWMRITRTGNTFVGSTSFNGTTWQTAFTATLVLPNCIDAGLFAQSINVNTPTLAAFSNLAGFNTQIPNITDQNTNNRSIDTEKEFSVYPNPASDEINVKWISGYTGKTATITVTNQLGQTVATQKLGAVTNEIETINVSQLTNGMYILSVQSEDKQTVHRKFTIGSIRP